MPVINMLTNVRTDEVSLVRRGANNRRWALTKSEDRNMKFPELLQSVLATKAEGEDELVATLKSADATDEAVEVAVAQYRFQNGFKDKLSADTFATVAKAAGFEPPEASDKKEDEEEDPKKPGFLLNGKKMPAKKSHTPAEMPAEMRKAFNDQATVLARLEKEASAKDARIEKIEKEALRKEYVTKCADEFSHVPGMSSEEMGEMLHNAYEVSQDFGEALEKQWKATSSALEKSTLLSAQGIAHTSQGESSAMGQLEAIAKEFIAKDPSLDRDLAIAKALEANPSLYTEYLKDNPAQCGGR